MRQIAFCFAIFAMHYCQVVATEARPNIILLMGDDHGWEETGYNGHPHVKTPSSVSHIAA